MARPWRSVSVPRLALFTLALTVGFVLLFGGLTSATTFGTYNLGWEGVSEFRTMATNTDGTTQLVTDGSAYTSASPSGSVSFVVSPNAAYTEAELDRIREFVRDGGTLVVAADTTNTSNQLLAGVGADARLDGQRLRDERYFDSSPVLPEASPTGEHPYTAGVETLTLNGATPVSAGGADVVVNSSSFSYVDANGNSGLDDDETLRAYPVVTSEAVGDGAVVTVGDSSMLINEMIDRGDNRRFLRNLVASNRVRLFDVSHSESLPPLVLARLQFQRSPTLQLGLGFLFVLVLSYGVAGVRLGSRVRARDQPSGSGLDATAVQQWVHDRRPVWERERARRVSEEIMRLKRNDVEDD